MATTDEEIRVRMGLDVSAMDNAVGVRSAAEKSAKTAAQEFKKWGHEASREIKKTSDAFSFFFENSFDETFKSLKRLVALNLVDMGLRAREYWDQFSKYIAETFYGVGSRIVEATGRAFDANRQFFREQRKQREEAAKQLEKERGQIASDAEKHLSMNEQIGEAVRRQMDLQKQLADMREKNISQLERERAVLQDQYRIDKNTAQLSLSNAKDELEKARRSGDKLRISQAELGFERAKADALRQQVEFERSKLDINNKITAIKRFADPEKALGQQITPLMRQFLDLQKLLQPSYGAPAADARALLEKSNAIFGSLSPEEQAALKGAGLQKQVEKQGTTLGEILDTLRGQLEVKFPNN